MTGTIREHTLIVGGTKGSGRTLAGRLAEDGHLVSIIGRTSGSRDGESDAIRIFSADITQSGEVESVMQDIASRALLTRIAFFQRYRGEGDTWEGELAVGPTAAQRIMEASLAHFATEGDRSVVFISSIAAHCVAVEQPAGYHVAKAAMVQLMRYWAASLGPRGVRVNAVSPSTTVKEESREFYEGFDDLNELYTHISPLGRMGTADELARTCCFFLSPASSFITGQNLTFDGGLSLSCQEGLARGLVGLEHPGTKK